MAASTTQETIVGVFPNHSAAQHAVQDLYDAGFTTEQVGMVAKYAQTPSGDTVVNEKRDEAAAVGGTSGAAVGAIGGAALGAGIVTGAIPVIGPVLAIGSLGTILLNAAGGAAAAGLTGALIGWGLGEKDADYYQSEVDHGRYLVTVSTGGRAPEALTILKRNSGMTRTPWNTSI